MAVKMEAVFVKLPPKVYAATPPSFHSDPELSATSPVNDLLLVPPRAIVPDTEVDPVTARVKLPVVKFVPLPIIRFPPMLRLDPVVKLLVPDRVRLPATEVIKGATETVPLRDKLPSIVVTVPMVGVPLPERVRLK